MDGVEITMSPLPAKFRKFFSALNASNRFEINSVVAAHMEAVFRRYIREIAPSNHKTANSFEPPAKPTGHLEKAARNTVGKVEPKGVSITVTSPGITRAFRDLDIVAKGKMLTIPARTAPEAYGKRAREVATMEPIFLVKSKTVGAFLATGTEPMGPQRPRGKRPPRPQRVRPHKPNKAVMEAKEENGIRPVFWLRAAVHIPKKRDILPSDATITKESKNAYVRGVEVRKQVLGL